jgi:hypothetical protein
MKQIVLALSLYAFLFAAMTSLFASPYSASVTGYNYHPHNVTENGIYLKGTVSYQYQPTLTIDAKLGGFSVGNASIHTFLLGVTKTYPTNIAHLSQYAGIAIGPCHESFKNVADNAMCQELTLGFEYKFQPQVSLTTDWVYFHAPFTTDASDYMLGIGLKYHF